MLSAGAHHHETQKTKHTHKRNAKKKGNLHNPMYRRRDNWPNSDGIVPVKLQPANEMYIIINRDHNTTD